MKNSKKIEASLVIWADRAQLWEVLFHQFGDTYRFNPNLDGSHLIGGEAGKVNCERHCDLDAKTYIQEKITNAEELNQFTIQVTGGNMPMIQEMEAVIALSEVDDQHTRVSLTAEFNTKPAFMAGVMKSSFRKRLMDMLVGLKYHLETGERVSKKSYKPVYRAYQQLGLAGSFSTA